MTQLEKVAKHYNWNPEFFETFAPNHYSCLNWEGKETLDEALKQTLELMESYLDMNKGDYVLELGYGRGEFSRHLINKGYDYWGIDSSIEQKTYCSNKLSNQGFRYDVRDFYNETTHHPRIISNEILVHVEDHKKFFKHCASLQKSGDKMVHKEMFMNKRGTINPIVCVGVLNPIFYWSGKYHLLQDDLDALHEAGYDVEVKTWAIENYIKTLNLWIANMMTNKSKLIKLEGRVKYFATLRAWVKFTELQAEGKYSEHTLICTKR